MVSISRPLSATKVSSYYKEDYSVASAYYSQNETLRGDWHGQIASTFGLAGEQIKEIQFDRLALGQHPITGEQLIRHRDTVKTEAGEEKAHRAAWDLVLSCGKSVSLAGLVGGDERIIEAHRKATRAAVKELETLAQARMGGNRKPETTGKLIVASFDHDSSRPVDGYAAPQIHTHCVVFNMTEDATGQARSIESKEFFVGSRFIGAIYQSVLERELTKLGYKTKIGKNFTVEIDGFSPEYLAAESLRAKQIRDIVEAKGLAGAEARFIAAHSTREEKMALPPEAIREAQRMNGERFGNQAQRIVVEARERGQRVTEHTETVAAESVEWARRKLSERESVFDHHELMTESLRKSRGKVTVEDIQREIERFRDAGKLVAVEHVRSWAPLWRYTTPEGIADERMTIEAVLGLGNRPAIRAVTDEDLAARYITMNEWQRKVVRETLASERPVVAIQGSAGTGKTFSTTAIREIAEAEGWTVHGLGPTRRATYELTKAGIQSQTIERYLRTGVPASGKRLFITDESSLTAARQMRSVISSMGPNDRLIIAGDRRQHQSVEAGRIFEELQLAGMDTARVNKLVRQQDEGLKKVVEASARGQTAQLVELLREQGRVRSIQNRRHRFAALAKDYASYPDGTLVISPDNLSRQEINVAIRDVMIASGKVSDNSHEVKALVNRQDLTRQDLKVAVSYEEGNIVLFRGKVKRLGQCLVNIDRGSYGKVLARDTEANTVTVLTDAGRVITYDPKAIRNVTVFSTARREFSLGDRIQFTASDKKARVSNRDLGTITDLDRAGNARVTLDAGHSAAINIYSHKHIEHGYCSTSHASQGATVDRVLVHIETGDSRVRRLVTDTLSYVSISRARYDARVYTDDVDNLAKALLNHQDNTMALSREQIAAYKQGPQKQGRAA